MAKAHKIKKIKQIGMKTDNMTVKDSWKYTLTLSSAVYNHTHCLKRWVKAQVTGFLFLTLLMWFSKSDPDQRGCFEPRPAHASHSCPRSIVFCSGFRRENWCRPVGSRCLVSHPNIPQAAAQGAEKHLENPSPFLTENHRLKILLHNSQSLNIWISLLTPSLLW